jgi:NADH-quinone oxidoreductase subunit N
MMITGALITVVSLFYYIKIPLNLFIKRADLPVNATVKSTKILILALVLSILIILLGVFPDLLLKYF